jgi:hypothetical protein
VSCAGVLIVVENEVPLAVIVTPSGRSGLCWQSVPVTVPATLPQSFGAATFMVTAIGANRVGVLLVTAIAAVYVPGCVTSAASSVTTTSRLAPEPG